MGPDRRLRTLLCNTFMSLVMVTALAYNSNYIKTLNDNKITLTNDLQKSVDLLEASYSIVLTAFIIGMLVHFVRQDALVYGMLLLLVVGWTLLFFSTFYSDGFDEKSLSTYNYPLAQLFQYSGIVIQGFINAIFLKKTNKAEE
ncbi:hypothetical protein pb186bvf_009557 [Paramecium bursaria]